MIEKKLKEECFMTHENSMEFRFQCPLKNFIGTQPCSFVYMLSVNNHSEFCKGSYIVSVQTVGPPKPKVFTVWAFTENVCPPQAGPALIPLSPMALTTPDGFLSHISGIRPLLLMPGEDPSFSHQDSGSSLRWGPPPSRLAAWNISRCPHSVGEWTG